MLRYFREIFSRASCTILPRPAYKIICHWSARFFRLFPTYSTTQYRRHHTSSPGSVPGESLRIRATSQAPYGPLWANIISSTKPAHNVQHCRCRHRRPEPRPQLTTTENVAKLDVWSLRYETQTDTLIAVIRTVTGRGGSEVISPASKTTYDNDNRNL